MKTYKLLMMVVSSIFTMAVCAQNNLTINQQWNSTRSKKELMKMEVMKIHDSPKALDKKILKKDIALNLSPKEQMKTSVVKLEPVVQHNIGIVNKSDKCTTCLKLSHLSAKEQMKISVVGLDTCTASNDNSKFQVKNCSICNMDVTCCN